MVSITHWLFSSIFSWSCLWLVLNHFPNRPAEVVSKFICFLWLFRSVNRWRCYNSGWGSPRWGRWGQSRRYFRRVCLVWLLRALFIVVVVLVGRINPGSTTRVGWLDFTLFVGVCPRWVIHHWTSFLSLTRPSWILHHQPDRQCRAWEYFRQWRLHRGSF